MPVVMRVLRGIPPLPPQAFIISLDCMLCIFTCIALPLKLQSQGVILFSPLIVYLYSLRLNKAMQRVRRREKLEVIT